MIPSHVIDEIRDKSDMLSVVSEYVKLKKTGKNYVGLCPFHSEKTGSFTVSPEKKLYHCFGCNEGGNIFAFIMKIENVSFSEAVKLLGEKTGIAVGKDEGAKGEKESGLRQAMILACEYFQKNLKDTLAGEAARNYLKDRGINEETIRSFKLGFSQDSWDSLTKYLTGRGVHPNDIEKAGLAMTREGGGLLDRFRGRLMFTIGDHRGRDIGFGGRILKEGEPKYMNSPETPIYNKGRILYGLNLSKDHIRRENTAIVVEGYMDAITCSQNGVKNVVASMGTALTSDQCKLLFRFCSNVILAYDTDIAGENATERGVELLKAEGFNVKIAEITGGKDPDELIRKSGAPAFVKIISEATPWIRYRINLTLRKFNVDEIEPRAKAIRAVASLLSSEPDRLIRAEYINYIAEKMNISPETIASEVKREGYYSRTFKGADQKRITEKPTPKILKAELNILQLAIENKEVRETLKANLHWGEFSDPTMRSIAELLFSVEIENEGRISSFLLETLPSEEARKKLSELLVAEHPVHASEAVNDYMSTIKAHGLSSRIGILRHEIEEAEKIKDIDRVKTLQREFHESSQTLRQLERKH